MTDQQQTALDLLTSIDATLKRIEAKLATTIHATPKVATASDLDGKYGDPEVRFNPKRWKGPSFKGKRYSQCVPEFLDELADALEFFADKDEASGAMTSNNKPLAPFRRADAARARGWAERIRSGVVPMPTPGAAPTWASADVDDVPVEDFDGAGIEF